MKKFCSKNCFCRYFGNSRLFINAAYIFPLPLCLHLFDLSGIPEMIGTFF